MSENTKYSPTYFPIASSSSLPTPKSNHVSTLHHSPSNPSSSSSPNVTFLPRSTPTDRTSPKRSVKRRPPTPGGSTSVAAFRKASKSQLAPILSQSTSPPAPMPATPAPTHPIASTSFTSSLSSLTQPPNTDNGSELHKRPRPVPSRLNLSGISNHTPHSSPSNDTAQPFTAIAVCLTPTSPRLLPSSSSNSTTPGPAAYQIPPSQSSGAAISLSVHQTTSTSTSTSAASNNTVGAPPDGAAYHSNAPRLMAEVNSNLNEGTTTIAGEPKDRQSVGTSTLLDSPSTQAMMDRLLAAPDYFSGLSPSGLEALDDDDDDDVSSGSLKFARGGMEDDDGLVSRRVREQRDRAKVKKLLGTDDSTEDFSRPQYVQGFWSDPDTGLNEIKIRRKASAGGGIHRAQGRSPGVKVGSPRDAGVPPNSVSSPTMPSHGYSSPREQGAMNITRKSEDGRTQSRQLYLGATPPVSPPWNYHPSPANRNRVPALDSLDPARSSGSIKRSKTISGAIDCAPPSPPVSGGYLQPPPRLSSKNALTSSKLSKRKSSRSPSPNVILTPQSNAPTPVGSPRDFSPRIRSSKSSKSMSSFKPQPPAPTPTAAGAIAEQYKRQIIETQDAAQTSVKERRRLSALKWMIEQTKSVTGGGKSSPASSNKSASPRLTDAKASSPAVASKLSKDDSSPRSTGPARLDTGVPPFPSPFSATTNESSVSLTLPETRLARTSSRPGGVGRGVRNDGPRSPVLGGFADSPGRSSSSFALPRSPATDEHISEEFGGAAYCAVVGAHVGHWNSSSASRTQRSSTGKPSGKEKSSFSLGLGRRLSKKRSGKRSNGPEVVEAVSSSKGNQDGIPRNRPRGRSVLVGEREKGGESSGSSGKVRVRRGHSLEKAPPLRHRRSLRLSIDKFADEEASPSAPGLAQRTHSSPAHSHPSKKPSASGSHFWKLVKRIGSSGGLRDKYQVNDGATHSYLPLSQAPSFSAISPEVDGNEVLTQLPSPHRRPSLDGSGLTSRVSKAAAAPTRKRSASVLKQASPSSADGHISYTRPPQHSSINTRSSTPASDHPSRVYHRTHSTRSSASSFADLGFPPPLPNPPSAFLGQRTFGSRSDGGHSSDSGHPTRPTTNKSSPLTATSTQRTPTDEDRMALDLVASFQNPPSLPTPPRRPKPVVLTSFPSTGGRGEYSDIESESPVIPEFSVNNAINQFKPKKQSGDDVNVNSNPLGPNVAQNTTQSLEAFPVLPPMMITTSTSVPPPPRPARDARRPTPSSADGGGPGTSGPGATVRKDSGLDSNIGQKQKSSHSSSQHAGYTGYGSKPPTSAFGPSPLFLKTSHQQPGVSENHQQQRPPPLPKRSNSSSPAAASPSTSIGSNATHTSSPVFRDLQSSSSPRTSGVGSSGALSEREKAERWNELLERSEKAGGTLHISLANNIDSHLSASPLSTPTSARSSGMMDFK